MKILFAPDSFSGSLSSERICNLLTNQARKYFPDCCCVSIPLSDGGIGTTKSIIHVKGGRVYGAVVKNPLFEDMEAFYGITGDGMAVIDVAAASGLIRIPEHRRNPMNTTSYGTGQLIADALNHGCRRIAVALGGSVTNDGGMGAMTALGIRFLDCNGRQLKGTGADLEKVCSIDTKELHKAAIDAEYTVLYNADNPLTGDFGATYTFGPRKGGEGETLIRLEKGMRNYAEVIHKEFGIDPSVIPGTGAAGGIGAAMMVFLGARLCSGLDGLLDLVDFDSLLEDTDLVITGAEFAGGLSDRNKVTETIGKRCKAAGIPAIAIVGNMGTAASDLYCQGIGSVQVTANGSMESEEAKEHAEELYSDAADRLFRTIKISSSLKSKKCNL